MLIKKPFKITLLVLAGLVAAESASSEIFRWVDEDGKVHFSDKPSRSHVSEPIKLRINTYEAVTYDTSYLDVGKKVVMYSASWCGVCKKARRYFESEGIRYMEYDVENSTRGKAEFRKLGGKGVPVILVGKQRMNGFSVDGFEKLYR
jgi:glutaredoxin